jgi:hypothetical protein
VGAQEGVALQGEEEEEEEVQEDFKTTGFAISGFAIVYVFLLGRKWYRRRFITCIISSLSKQRTMS